MKNPLTRIIFRTIDHRVIYLTIAGSYTKSICIFACEKKCLVNAIVLEDNRPVWVKDK